MGGSKVTWELDGLIVRSPCPGQSLSSMGQKTYPWSLMVLSCIRPVLVQSLSSHVPINRPPRREASECLLFGLLFALYGQRLPYGDAEHKPLNAHCLAYCLLCMVGIPETGIPSI